MAQIQSDPIYHDVDPGQSGKAPTGDDPIYNDTDHPAPPLPVRNDPGFLGAKPDDSAIAQGAKYTATGAAKALSHVPGFAGDLAHFADLTDWVGDRMESALSGKSMQDIAQQRHASMQNLDDNFKKVAGFSLPNLDPRNYLPSGQDIQNRVFQQTGQYTPTSTAGRVGQEVMEGMTPGLAGKENLVGGLGRYLTHALPAGVSFATGNEVQNATDNPILGLASSILAGKATSMAPRAMSANTQKGSTSIGEHLAGEVLRNTAKAPSSTILSRLSRPLNLFSGMKPTAAGLSQDAGHAGLEEVLNNSGPGDPGHQQRVAANNTAKENGEKYAEGIQGAAQALDPQLQTKYGLTGSTPAAGSSQDARDIFDKFEKPASDAADKAWENPALAQSKIYVSKTFKPLLDYISGGKALLKPGDNPITQTDAGLIPNDVKQLINNFATGPQQAPMLELQSLRSRILGDARAAGRAGNNNQARVLGNIGGKIGDLLNDQGNFIFRDQRQGIPAWNAARQATKDYYDAFGHEYLDKLTSSKVDPNATLDQAMSSGNKAVSNIQALRKATQNQVDPAISDYLVAKLTNNGQKLVSPEDVDKFIADKRTGPLVNQIPGLADRLKQIRAHAQQHALSTDLADNADKPHKIFPIITDPNNAAVLNNFAAAGPPGASDLVTKLRHSTAHQTNVPPEMISDPLLDQINQNKLGTKLYGTSGKGIAGATTLGGMGAALFGLHKTPMDIYAAIELLKQYGPWAGAGSIGAAAGMPTAGKVMAGRSAAKAIESLQKARVDPAYKAHLMKLPDLPNPPTVFAGKQVKVGNKTLPGVPGPIGIMGAMGVDQAMRQPRASGGRVMDHDAEAEGLLREADKARNDYCKETKALLSVPDEAVTKALSIANESI